MGVDLSVGPDHFICSEFWEKRESESWLFVLVVSSLNGFFIKIISLLLFLFSWGEVKICRSVQCLRCKFLFKARVYCRREANLCFTKYPFNVMYLWSCNLLTAVQVLISFRAVKEEHGLGCQGLAKLEHCWIFLCQGIYHSTKRPEVRASNFIWKINICFSTWFSIWRNLSALNFELKFRIQ